MSWTEERVELLKKLWADGLSASQIAGELGGITRNAVIGKVHRLGLSGRAKSPSSSAPRARKPRSHMMRVSRPSMRGNTALALAYDMEPFQEPELIENIIPIGQRRTLLEFNEDTCRWPIGDPATPNSSSAAARRCRACPIARITRASPISRPATAATAARRRHSGRVRRCHILPQSLRALEPIPPLSRPDRGGLFPSPPGRSDPTHFRVFKWPFSQRSAARRVLCFRAPGSPRIPALAFPPNEGMGAPLRRKSALAAP